MILVMILTWPLASSFIYPILYYNLSFVWTLCDIVRKPEFDRFELIDSESSVLWDADLLEVSISGRNEANNPGTL